MKLMKLEAVNNTFQVYTVYTYKLTEHYVKTDYKKRHHIMRSLKKANLNFAEVRRLGYPVSRHLWRQCGNRSERNLGKLNNLI
jgi:hypothetical protein